MRFLPTLALIALAPFARAQSDTAHHRAVYNEINAAADSLPKATATAKGPDGPVALTGWLDHGTVSKIVARPGNTGTGFDEYYLEDGKPLFVFTVHKSAENGKRVEERLYFTDGQITKWLSTDKTFVPHGEDYAGLTERLNADAATYVSALQPKSATTTAKTHTATGTFLGIEQGDYAHWNMRTTDDTDLSLFILHPDASVEKVLADPDAFTGRRCRVSWRESSENIPEAGGEQTISQLLSVEWLARK